MENTAKVLRLEAELQLRKRTILFLISEYVSRNIEERGKVIAFLEEVMPDMSPEAAEIAATLLAEVNG